MDKFTKWVIENLLQYTVVFRYTRKYTTEELEALVRISKN